jgi:Iron-containing redox enzyme
MMRRARHSEQLRTKLRIAKPCLDAAADSFWRHPKLARMFPDYLFMMHSIIRSSVALMGAAAERARSLGGGDAVAAELAEYYARHAREEMHHDDWLLEDMVAIGMDRAAVRARLPGPTAASLVGAQYYWVLHVHPAALLGYLAVLEGFPPSEVELARIRARNHLPPAGFRTMVKHARLDPHHRDELDRTIDRLPLRDELAGLVGMSALHTIEHIGRAFEEIVDSHRN